MRLDHVLAATPLGEKLTDDQQLRAAVVLGAFGFVLAGTSHVLDDQFPWVTVAPDEGTLRVHVRTPLPVHLVETLSDALDGLVREASLVRIDPLTRRAIEPGDWARRFAKLPLDTPPRGRL